MTGTTDAQTAAAPPPPPPAAVTPLEAPQRSRPAATVVAVTMIVVGALIGVGTVVGAGLNAASALAFRTSERSTSAAGVDTLRLDIGAADLRIEFADVTEAELEVTGRDGADDWTLDTDGSDLVVASSAHDLGGPFGRGDDATLRLPERLAGIDADLTVGVSDLVLDGEFGALALELEAGDAQVEVSATSLTLLVEAGDADLTVQGAETVDVTASAGDVVATLSGVQPASIAVTANGADVDLTVPSGYYLLTGDAADGDLMDTDLRSVEDATSTIDAHVAGSDVTISAAR